MSNIGAPLPASVWAGRVISGFVVIFMAVDGLIGFVRPQMLQQSLAETGYQMSQIGTISLLALICAAIYAIPRTAMLGAILVTAYLGGAIATHFRVSSGIVPPQIVSVAIAALAWLGLWLRDARLRALLPISFSASTPS